MKSPKILIVEDETIIALEIASSLEELGYQVAGIVSSGSQALEIAERDPPQLILMDIYLAGHLNGIDTASQINATSHIPIIYLTAFADEEILERAKKTLPHGYLIKPVQDKELKAAVEIALYVSAIENQKRTAEAALRESEEKYQALVENTPDFISRVDQNGRHTFVSSNHVELFGINPEEWIGKTHFELGYSQETALQIQNKLDFVLNNGVSEELNFLFEGGPKSRILNLRMIPEKNDSGLTEHVLFITRDVTTSETINMENRRQAEFIFRVINSFSHPFYIINTETYVIELSNEAANHQKSISGMPKCYEHFFNRSTPCHHEERPCPLFMVLKTGSPACIERVMENGNDFRILEIQAHPIVSSEGNVVQVIKYYIDITERKKAEQSLLNSEKRYQDLYENAPEMYASIDMYSLNIIECNQTLADKTGYSKKEILGKQVFNFCSTKGKEVLVSQILPEFLKAGTVDKQRLQLRRKDGYVIDVSMNASAIHDVQGIKISCRSSFRDITQLRKIEKEKTELERQVQQMQKMDALGTLASGIAHDFNNILHPILGYASMGLKRTRKTDKLHDYFNQIYSVSKRAKELINQIFTFSRQSAQKPGALKLQPILKETVRMFHACLPSTITIEPDIDETCGMVMAEVTKIHQVVMNIATNAFHAMEETGGKLHISLKNVESSPEEPSFVCINIADTGYGMSADIQQKIFEPYFTTKSKDKGTGLGLSVVLGIVRSYGGYIKVSSVIGSGTEFKVFLPQVIHGKHEPEQKDVDCEYHGSEKILFVDDELHIVQMAIEMLEQLGYRVTGMTSSSEALEVFRTQPDRFDMVITDFRMPKLSGMHFASEVLKCRPDLPILMCSGFVDTIDLKKAKDLGICELVSKPLTMHDFASVIRKHLTVTLM